MRILAWVLAVVVALLLFEAGVLVYAWSLHRGQKYDAEISWLERTRGWLPWESGMNAQLSKLYRERIRRELDNGRLDGAVRAFRDARRRQFQAGHGIDRELMALGIECFTRAADHVEGMGRLSQAADWDDSLFVLAIRAAEPHHRFAASAAFLEGADLRVRDGKPCAALARVEWAKQGLGGEIPGVSSQLETDLRTQCRGTRRGGRRR